MANRTQTLAYSLNPWTKCSQKPEKSMKLPSSPTPKQVEAIALATIQEVFEDEATDLRDLTIPGDGTWSASYTAGSMDFDLEWDGEEFIKSVAN
jgi:hypothetical protein